METLMQEAQKIAQLNTLSKKRSLLMQKINSIDEKINSLLSSKGNGYVYEKPL